MKVNFKTAPTVPPADKVDVELEDHKEIVIPRKGEAVIFNNKSYYVENVVYNYAASLIGIFINNGIIYTKR